MRKPESLRQWLESCLPELRNHPDQLQVYVDNGNVAARRGETLSFSYGYTLAVLLTDYTGSPDQVVVPLLAWIEQEQPDLLQRTDSQPFRYEAEILDRKRVDLLFQLDLTERVIVTPRADNTGFDIAHPAPPANNTFTGICASWLRQCYAGTELVAETQDPAVELKPGIPPEVGP
ncbi:MAG TPA: phage tail protein [Pedomonas sp.]|uniref:phage tail protein n=1 Tax=Pedomonas sp. TaxID=2976421 RepID=UPI002F41B525